MMLVEEYMRDIVPIEDTQLIWIFLFREGLFIYYLRLDNNRTPFINTLTVLILAMSLGEYVLGLNSTLGQIVFIISVILFGIVFFIRQKLKDHFDKMSKLKIAAVSLFVLANIIVVGQNGILVGIGVLLMASVYLYDRLIKIADAKENRA